MIYINITKFKLISQLQKDYSMIETYRLKNIEVFIQTQWTHLCLFANEIPRGKFKGNLIDFERQIHVEIDCTWKF